MWHFALPVFRVAKVGKLSLILTTMLLILEAFFLLLNVQNPTEPIKKEDSVMETGTTKRKDSDQKKSVQGGIALISALTCDHRLRSGERRVSGCSCSHLRASNSC